MEAPFLNALMPNATMINVPSMVPAKYPLPYADWAGAPDCRFLLLSSAQYHEKKLKQESIRRIRLLCIGQQNNQHAICDLERKRNHHKATNYVVRDPVFQDIPCERHLSYSLHGCDSNEVTQLPQSSLQVWQGRLIRNKKWETT